MKTIKKYFEFSKLIAYAMLVMVMWISCKVLSLAELAISTQFTGAIPYLTAMIGAVWTAGGTVLSFLMTKNTKENIIKLQKMYGEVNTIEDIPCEESDF